MRKSVYCVALWLFATASVVLAPLPARGADQENKSQATSLTPQAKCTFSDGGTIAFGRGVSGNPETGANSWRAGNYAATTLVVSERMIIPPLDGGLEIPTGTYTLFVTPGDTVPWTLIISKKSGEWGMPYPGDRYDLGRTQMGSDIRQPVANFTIGCTQHPSAPIFLWMQSGTRVAYVKIMAEKSIGGETEYVWH